MIVQNGYAFDTEVVTGKQIKETANIPAGSLSTAACKVGTRPIPDDAPVALRNGDHFFARPLSNVP